jgi:hypothetical protein
MAFMGLWYVKYRLKPPIKNMPDYESYTRVNEQAKNSHRNGKAA